MKEHNTRQWVHTFYENQETMVLPTDRLRLFDISLAARLETAPKLQVLWLQTVQLIANRHNPHPLQRVETDSSVFRFYNRARPPETSESDSDADAGNLQYVPTTNKKQYPITLQQLVLPKDPSQLEACEREAPSSSFFSVFPVDVYITGWCKCGDMNPAGDRNINMAFTNWKQQK